MDYRRKGAQDMEHLTQTQYKRLREHGQAGPRSSMIRPEEWPAPCWVHRIDGLGPAMVHPDDKVTYRAEWGFWPHGENAPTEMTSNEPTSFADAKTWLLAEFDAHYWEWRAKVRPAYAYRLREMRDHIERWTEPKYTREEGIILRIVAIPIDTVNRTDVRHDNGVMP